MSEPRIVVAGHCTIDSVKLLAVFDPPLPPAGCVYLFWRINGESRSITAPIVPAHPYSLALFELHALPPDVDGSILEYSISSNPVAEGRPFQNKLKLLPAGRPLRIALVSCNGVYRIKSENRRYLLWRALKDEVRKRRVDLVIHAGDQIYADPIVRLSNQDLTSEYRRTYVETWSPPDIAAVLSSCPSLMMWDDHDIFDGYGSHGDDSSPMAQNILAAAKRAFWEFQGQKNPAVLGSHSFGFGVQVGTTAILMLDGRSNRMWTEGRILGEAQLKDMENWLSGIATQRVDYLLLVTAVPFLHVPVMSYLKLLEYTGSPGGLLEDLRDSWTASNNRKEGERMLTALFAFSERSPNTHILLMSGDVHVGTIGSLRSSATQTTIHQVVSSGIGSPPPYGIVRMLLRWAASEKVTMFGGMFQGQLHRLRAPDDDFLLAKRNFAIIDLASDEVEFFADDDGNVVRFTTQFRE